MANQFIDTATITVRAGKGGNGCVSFHREKYVAAGGPDGGDGGRGGDVIFVADPNLSTLMDFRYKTKYQAPAGENGRGNRCFGRNAEPLVIRVPRGTVIREQLIYERYIPYRTVTIHTYTVLLLRYPPATKDIGNDQSRSRKI